MPSTPNAKPLANHVDALWRNRALRRLALPLLVCTLLAVWLLDPFHFNRPTDSPQVPSDPATALLAAELSKNAAHLAAQAKTVAVIIEARPLSNLISILLYFAGFLGPEWPIHIYHSSANVDLIKSSSAILTHIRHGRIVLHALPETTKLETHDSISEFLTNAWMWQTLGDATHALFFQADSILCGSSPLRPENFLGYSFVGAPIAPAHGKGFNGGLSLRHIPTMLRTIEKFHWSETRLYEDQWFANHIPLLTDPPAPPLPTIEQSKYFAVETIWAEKPMGYHQAKRWNAGRMSEILEWCPELALAEEGTLHNRPV
ncbi:hypothetical protein BDZ88DRAFT_332534 [Geranomyces variabilis]|nr:hypothetical protein BDZ88DRAFT_332534 [Geranomyces variabilis]KAJ3134347.1 hypothetical protein HDU90_005215 [Geranomyces variabilis]